MTGKLRRGTLNVTGSPGKTTVCTSQTMLRRSQSEGQKTAAEQLFKALGALNSRRDRRAALTHRAFTRRPTFAALPYGARVRASVGARVGADAPQYPGE